MIEALRTPEQLAVAPPVRATSVGEPAIAWASDAQLTPNRASAEWEKVHVNILATEPLPKDSALLGRDNVILTPHTGFYSIEALEELQTKCAADVARATTRTVVIASLLVLGTVALHAAKTDGWNILTGANAWSDSSKLVPGTRPITDSGTRLRKAWLKPPIWVGSSRTLVSK